MNLERVQKVKTLILRYQRPLVHYSLRFVGDIHTARDVVQEAFLRLWQQDLDKLSPNEKPWLYRVCRNLSLDWLKSGGANHRSLPLDSEESQLDDPRIDQGKDLEEKQWVSVALEQLTSNQQEVVRLKFQDDLSYKEISEITGHSVSHVGVLLHEAMKKLRQHYQQTNGEENHEAQEG